MKAYEKAKAMGSGQLIDEIAATGLLEFGADRTSVADKWKLVNEERELQTNPIRVVAGLNNSDMNGALLAILKENPDKVLEGMQIAALAVDAEEMYLYLPEWEDVYTRALEEKAASYGVQIRTGIVNVRESRGGAFHHIETVAVLADLLKENREQTAGQTDGSVGDSGHDMVIVQEGLSGNGMTVVQKGLSGTCLAVCRNGITGPLQWVPYGTRLTDLITGQDGETDLTTLKAIAVGTRLYDAATALDMVIRPDTRTGNGVVTLYDSECCMIHEAEQVLAAERRHSCGKCTFCREGLIQLHTMMKEITLGQGKKNFVEMMTEIGEAMTFSTLCSMGQTASDFTMGTLRFFSSEYNDHIRKKKCANNVCSAFQSIYVDPNACQGCEKCADVCPKNAIEGRKGYIHMIDEFECNKCGKCLEVCESDAIIQTAGRVPKLPTRLTKVGKFRKR
ncbi:MAG: 4Fe-4S binding protein [Clostridiales bacterium]|nr:4Fe-4S binding protein [Clostridiales bacterium]